MAESLFQLGGAPASKQVRNVPLCTSVFFSGIWSQRSPFGSPDSRYFTKFIGGRTDILIDGLNTELTNYGTLIRRPGFLQYSSALLNSGALSFYSFHPIGQPIAVIADTATNVYTLSPTTATSILIKSNGAGQTYFQGIGNTLYMGNGVDQKAYPNNGTARNWGIALGSIIGSVTNTAAIGADGGGVGAVWSNPGNVSSAVNYATAVVTAPAAFPPPTQVTFSNGLNATNFGYALATGAAVFGIQVQLDELVHVNGGASSITVQLLKAGSPIGDVKSANTLNTTVSTLTFGSPSDLWGTSWTYNDINSATFGAQVIAYVGNIDAGDIVTFSIRNVKAIVSTITAGGPPVTLVGGTLVGNYSYIYAYGNSSSGDVSNPTTPSATLTAATNGIQVTLTASSDSQVNQIRVFRTKAGGATYFELSTSPYPNSSGNITDTSADSTLQLLNNFPATTPWLANSPPPAGLVIMTYHLGRMWGAIGNNVYFSALLGDDITLGVGVECWPPVNVFVFPNTVHRLLPIASGLLVFTEDDVYIIIGSTRAQLFAQLFQQGVGILSYNALDVEGNQIFLYTSNKTFLDFTAAGPNEIGFPIGLDLQASFNPASVYVAALVAGTQDKAVFIADGSANWYRCNWNQPPEGGPAWSPKATITGNLTSAVSVETSPGVHQLLVGQSSGKVLVRDYSTFSDNGTAYSAFATVGSLVLAKPGQLAVLNNIILELQKTGTVPTLSLMLDEISGNHFETLIQSGDDPPRLPPSQTVMSKRWYLSQGQNSAYCRHCQVKVTFAAEAAKNELLTMTAVGGLLNDE